MQDNPTRNIKYYAVFLKISSWLIVPPIIGLFAKEILIKYGYIKDSNLNLLLILGVSFIFSMIGVIFETRKYISKI